MVLVVVFAVMSLRGHHRCHCIAVMRPPKQHTVNVNCQHHPPSQPPPSPSPPSPSRLHFRVRVENKSAQYNRGQGQTSITCCNEYPKPGHTECATSRGGKPRQLLCRHFLLV
ncbi:hypothetical protein BGY98DRAFT_973479 [Russula aff. rugulosa BPL654]|nr:hypothetical protein BGY98DRAFT_973479 [Russula aff. rugulosa BPL654]